MYEADLPRIENPDVHFKAVPKDRALVYINDKYENSLNRMDKSHNFWLVNRTEPAKNVKILVENMGRVNYGNVDTEDFKVYYYYFIKKVNLSSLIQIKCFRVSGT